MRPVLVKQREIGHWEIRWTVKTTKAGAVLLIHSGRRGEKLSLASERAFPSFVAARAFAKDLR